MIFADSCVLIYAVEDLTSRGDEVRRRLVSDVGRIAASPLVEFECRVGPLRRGNAVLVRRYERLFEQLLMVDLPNEVYSTAASIRARHHVQTADALHIATAQFHQCDSFWTNDKRLRSAAGGLPVHLVPS